ncbi:MAG: sensor histidine kinase, partial [Thermodesulfobacteriota bacterium]
ELLEIDAFDGRKKIILNYTAPVLGNSGQVLGAIVMNVDVTESRRAEAEQERLLDQLIQARKMESVGRLAGGVAHDFNNMLSVIIGNAEIALESVSLNDPLYEDLKEILSAARRSSEITGQLLAFARRQTIHPEVVDLNDAVEGMLKMLRRLIGEDIRLAWTPGSELWPVRMDPAQIHQILANLLANARDAIAGVGNITLETGNVRIDAAGCAGLPGFVPGEYVMLMVRDNGCGMGKEALENLFEPFFTTKPVGEGTGLGLATVYGIVKQNNGFVYADSEPDQGATFRIYLPRHTGPAEAVPNRAPAPAIRGGNETLLVVEDEAAVLKLARRMLS